MRLVFCAAGAALLLAGCQPGYVDSSEADVFMRIVDISPNPLDSDVRSDEGVIDPDRVTVSIANRAKSRLLDIEDKINLAVFLERYEVRFYRSDGRDAPGVDVPYGFSGEMNGVIDAENSGASPFTIEIVRRQSKLEAPLKTLQALAGPNGGQVIFTCFAEITVYARQTNGRVVSTTARTQVNFADFAG